MNSSQTSSDLESLAGSVISDNLNSTSDNIQIHSDIVQSDRGPKNDTHPYSTDDEIKPLSTQYPNPNGDGDGKTTEDDSFDTGCKEGDMSDDIESLLSLPVSKDYINCVWSNVPVAQASPKKSPSPTKKIKIKVIDGQTGASLSCNQNTTEQNGVSSSDKEVKLVKKTAMANESNEESPKKISGEVSEKINAVNGDKHIKAKATKKSKGNSSKIMEGKDLKGNQMKDNEDKDLPMLRNLRNSSPKTYPTAKVKINVSREKIPGNDKGGKKSCHKSESETCNEVDKSNSLLEATGRIKGDEEKCASDSDKVHSMSANVSEERVNVAHKTFRKLPTVRSLQPVDPSKLLIRTIVQPRTQTTQTLLKFSPSQEADSKELQPNLAHELLSKASVNPKEMLFTGIKQVLFPPSRQPYTPRELDLRFFERFYSCKACGDKFTLKSSLQSHLSRKAGKLVLNCSFCREKLIYQNRCMLLIHALSHGMRIDDISPGDVQVSPLNDFSDVLDSIFSNTSINYIECSECRTLVSSLKRHLMGAKCKVFSQESSFDCQECGYILPTKCAFTAHNRYHSGEPPHLCPDCGDFFLSSSAMSIHMKENCLHNVKRAVFHCGRCNLQLPSKNSFEEHILSDHTRIIYSCDVCGLPASGLNCFNVHRDIMHELPDILPSSDAAAKLSSHVQCDFCPGEMVDKNSLLVHNKLHSAEQKCVKRMYQCEFCEALFSSRDIFKSHKCMNNSGANVSANDSISNLPGSPAVGDSGASSAASVKPATVTEESSLKEETCDSIEENIIVDRDPKELKNSSKISRKRTHDKLTRTVCKLCKNVVSGGADKGAIKQHFINYHFGIFMKAVHLKEVNIPTEKEVTSQSKPMVTSKKKKILNVLSKSDKNKKGKSSTSDSKDAKSRTLRKKAVPPLLEINPLPPDLEDLKKLGYKCYKCDFHSEDSVAFRQHIAIHKSNISDLQCPECGLCFIVRPPLEKHLIAEHRVKNISTFMKNHGFEDDASEEEEEKPPCLEEEDVVDDLQENQCKVCREKFDSALLLEKHFRVHGGAFLLAKLKAQRS